MVFLLSALFFQERYLRQKTLAIAGVLLGIVLTILH
jgi:drug/metabolite transporter (DMT)-like permease